MLPKSQDVERKGPGRTFPGLFRADRFISHHADQPCFEIEVRINGRNGDDGGSRAVHRDMGPTQLKNGQQDEKVGEKARVRVLGGEPASAIPLVADAGLAPMFDWRQLERWSVRERSLPPGSIVLFRPRSIWQEHGRAIGVGLGVIALESLLVAGLVFQLRRRRRVERELARAETRYRTVADFTHD